MNLKINLYLCMSLENEINVVKRDGKTVEPVMLSKIQNRVKKLSHNLDILKISAHALH